MTLTEILDPATKHAVVLDLIHESFRVHQRSEARLCLALYRAFRDNLHRGLGISRFEDYAERKFGIRAKLASLFKFIGSNIARLPLTLAALDAGKLTYTKVREFVALATPQTEAEWIEFAKTHTNREIEKRVRRKQQKDGTEKTTYKSSVTPEERQAVRKAREVLSEKEGRRVAPEEVLGKMATAFANGLFEDLREEESSNGKKKPPPTKYVSFQPCPICLDTYVPTPEGLLAVPADIWIKAAKDGAEIVDATPEFFCDCEGEKHRRDRCSNWTLREANVGKNRYTPVEFETLIQARDGFVCRNPVCRCELPLHGSHLKPHRDGAPPTPENMRQHCATCNGLIEAGNLRVVGEAPFERYYDAEGAFLGWGYHLEPSPPEADPAAGDPHVGMSGRGSRKAERPGPNGAASPPSGG